MTNYKFFSKADEIRIEVFRRDLTKRQKAIVWMVHLYSFSMGKDEAIIPKLSDFELCGVSKYKVKAELEKLIEINVLRWEKDINTFSIISPLDWNAPVNDMWDQVRFDSLYELNREKK